MSDEWTVNKVGATVMFSGEVLAQYLRENQPTNEDRARWAAERAERDRRFNEYAARIDGITDPLARAVLDLHRREGDYLIRCVGCDADGFDAEWPEWPCRTVELIGERFGLETP